MKVTPFNFLPTFLALPGWTAPLACSYSVQYCLHRAPALHDTNINTLKSKHLHIHTLTSFCGCSVNDHHPMCTAEYNEKAAGFTQKEILL